MGRLYHVEEKTACLGGVRENGVYEFGAVYGYRFLGTIRLHKLDARPQSTEGREDIFALVGHGGSGLEVGIREAILVELRWSAREALS